MGDAPSLPDARRIQSSSSSETDSAHTRLVTLANSYFLATTIARAFSGTRLASSQAHSMQQRQVQVSRLEDRSSKPLWKLSQDQVRKILPELLP